MTERREESMQNFNIKESCPDRKAYRSIAVLILVCPTLVTAQSNVEKQTPLNGDQLEEIVVTAQKREQRLLDVPSAVTALSASELTESNKSRLRDFFGSVPGFQVAPSPGGGGQQTLAIRGVSSGAFANPTVGIVIDDVPLGSSTYDFSPDVDPSDLQRVEVLRGPQGTLYGASSMGGLVKFVTLAPTFNDSHGRIEAGLNTVRHGEELGHSLRASLNLPVSDTVAARFSGFTREEPGYIDNLATNQADINSVQLRGGLTSILWTPLENVSVKLSALYQQMDTDGSSEEVRAQGLAEYQQNYILNTGQSFSKTQSYGVVVKADMDAVDFTSVTAYSKFNKSNVQDYSSISPWGGLALSQFGVEGAPSYFEANVERLTQEIRSTFNTSQNLQWSIGAFYSDEDTPIFQQILGQDEFGTLVGDVINFDIPFKYREVALFANPTYHFSDQFSIQFGGRQSWTRSIFDEVTLGGALNPSPVVLPEINEKEQIFTYLVTPQFKVNEDLMIYGRIATGYRPGRSNSFNPDETIPRAAEADTTTNYEVGVKASALSGKLSFEASVYRIDWDDLQITLLSANNGLAFTSNAAGAKSEGLELSASLRLRSGFSFSGWTSFNNAVLTEGVVNAATFSPTGARLPFSAKFTANFAVEKSFAISQHVNLSLGVAYGYVGQRFGNFVETAARSNYPSFSKLDFKAGMDFGDSWSVDLYANNIGDVRGELGGGPSSFPSTAYSFVQPRTTGILVSKEF